MHFNRICIIDDLGKEVQVRYKVSLSVYRDLVWKVNQCKSTRATQDLNPTQTIAYNTKHLSSY